MNQLDLNTNAHGEILAGPDAGAPLDLKETRENATVLLAELEPVTMLGLWLRALVSFFDSSNHPLTETEQADLSRRDFANELLIARAVLLECSRLAHRLAAAESDDDALFEETDDAGVLNSLSLAEEASEPGGLAADQPLLRLTEVIGQFSLLIEDLLLVGPISFPAWSNIGKMLARELERSEAARFIRQTTFRNGSNLQPQLLRLAHDATLDRAFATDMLLIFSRMMEMLGWLAVVESSLRRDLPLKQMLPIFTLINQETRELRRFVENHTLRIEELDSALCDVLDGTNYALAMELRKVFSRELVGVNTLRHPPTIYAKVETAHGILRDSFQQSIVALTQLFDPTLDGTLLFKAYQTKKTQSLTLRSDLWMLLQLIQRAEKERERHPVVRLIERLVVFQQGSLNYLMYKDWEACERFIEEVGAARGAVELAPVLHRFAAFIETLFSQVSMRSVLADCPFDFPAVEK